ncbi:DNA-binding MarR family transcriptional regulator [Kitasatospora gansuensis]|uniref:DNA-binding MarR family transcriptional regulator n=1 Tax=Kitasatospora gansuensis TaxID=258050 RepID=A0A7W7SJE7_9ACTN|nr:transcriptional regulator [Kitasatospora gansuensis]MBB4951589.1 DNA-binding MarR family transcriptional regulator [Kitasatospora gansuensis]
MTTGDADPQHEDELHPTNTLDDTVHQRVRLGILTIAREADRVDFGFLKAQLAVTDGNLSRHVKVLEDSGLISVEKGYAGRRPRTWVLLTSQGAQALERELRALRELVQRLDNSPPRPPAADA